MYFWKSEFISIYFNSFSFTRAFSPHENDDTIKSAWELVTFAAAIYEMGQYQESPVNISKIH